jgi:hypothetical protein
VASVRYGGPAIQWAGVVLVMADGTKRAIEFRHPYDASLTYDRLSRYDDGDMEFTIRGAAYRWHQGEQAEPTQPVQAIATPTLEIERG